MSNNFDDRKTDRINLDDFREQLYSSEQDSYPKEDGFDNYPNDGYYDDENVEESYYAEEEPQDSYDSSEYYEDDSSYEEDNYEAEEDYNPFRSYSQNRKESDSGKPRKKKKRRKKHYLLKFFILVAVVVFLVVFSKSSFFNVKNFVVENNNYYTEEQILKMADIKKGTNIFKVGTGKIETELEKDPYIKTASLKRKLPSTIVISIVERAEYAYVKYNKKYYTISSGGLVLAQKDKKPDAVRITGIKVRSAAVGEPVKTEDDAKLTQALKLIKASEDYKVPLIKVQFKRSVIKCYVYKKLYIKGFYDDIYNCMKNGKLQAVIYDLDSKKIKKGELNVGEDGYCIFSPDIE